jgi:hypothetical protein
MMPLTYTEIIAEAKRFIKKCEEAEKNRRWHSKEGAAAKRASMDLTRALAEFRRS